MKSWIALGNAVLAIAGAFVLASFGGCLSPTFLANQTAVRSGNLTFDFVNNTRFRASFSFGTFDALDRSPGNVGFEQMRLEAGLSASPTVAQCARNAVIGTQEFIDRVLATDSDQTDDFDADAFSTVVHFSSAPADSATAGLPDIGTATGLELLLGVDFSCDDRIVFTFEEDPDAPGGFRIDFVVIQDEPN
ncbi:MAG: hypothetical protein IH986_09450 [Planctomycetes bacterium]|nr:hypothetical protein [Planctomycetota bacterium]